MSTFQVLPQEFLLYYIKTYDRVFTTPQLITFKSEITNYHLDIVWLEEEED